MDGLRAVAALAVFVFHAYGNYVVVGGDVNMDLRAWLDHLGLFGIATFFLISGFLLYRPFVRSAFDGRPAPAVLPFWIRRAVRIFPAYWLALTAYVQISKPLPSIGDYLTAYALLGNYRRGQQFAGIGVAWTLSIEVAFYVVLPLLALCARAVARRRSLRIRLGVQLAMLALLYVVGLATRAWWWGQSLDPPFNEPRGAWFSLRQINFWLIGNFDWFALGMLLAVASAWAAGGGRLPGFVGLLARVPAVCWALAVLSYGLVVETSPARGVVNTDLDAVLPEVFVGLAALCFLLPAVFGDMDAGVIRRVLRTRVAVFLGTISYGIYLWHLLALFEVGDWRDAGDIPNVFVVWSGLALLLTIGVATASFYVLERPLIRWSRRGFAPQRVDQPGRVGHGARRGAT